MFRRGVLGSWPRIVSVLALAVLGTGIAGADNVIDSMAPYQNSSQLAASYDNAPNPVLGSTFSNNDARVFGTMLATGVAAEELPGLQSNEQLLDTPEYKFDCSRNTRDCVLVSTFNMPVVQEVAQAVVVIDVNAVAQSESVPYHTPIPEPASIVLLGSGLAALAGISWRRQDAE